MWHEIERRDCLFTERRHTIHFVFCFLYTAAASFTPATRNTPPLRFVTAPFQSYTSRQPVHACQFRQPSSSPIPAGRAIRHNILWFGKLGRAGAPCIVLIRRVDPGREPICCPYMLHHQRCLRVVESSSACALRSGCFVWKSYANTFPRLVVALKYVHILVLYNRHRLNLCVTLIAVPAVKSCDLRRSCKTYTSR